MISRRTFFRRALLGMGGIALSGAAWRWAARLGSPAPIPGSLVGASAGVGHRLREAIGRAPDREERVGTVIVGGGVAGLSAAWWLRKHGNEDYVLLELEDDVGGNSRWSRNETTAYPWGAHYLPLPGPDAHLVRELLEELDVIVDYDARGLPVFDERYLCADPHERLLQDGRWHDGLVPRVPQASEARRHYDAFFAAMERFKSARGKDGKRAFAIPVAASSQDPTFLALDAMTMEEYLRRNGWTSRELRWYVEYCCRDDYGRGVDKVSAWAGIHYFASRVGRGANADAQTVLTWPEGNGWIVERLRQPAAGAIRSHSLAFSVQNDGNEVLVDSLDTRTKQITRLRAEHAILAIPRFVAARLVREWREQRPAYLDRLVYAPWVVANVTVADVPDGRGAPLSWDNVSRHDDSLGYIVATHQHITAYPGKTVLTFYRALDREEPSVARRAALTKTHAQWAGEVVASLARMHPGIDSLVERVDVCVWGHGMISPDVDFLWSADRRRMLASVGNIHFAHSDMSGISIFEEAQYHGVEAAKRTLGPRSVS